ncbi:hypothetical protein, partial [Leifsonia aquatica]|uniref:hypothetical protein n=1 Tax=Leifsonia aquatica TaxID=144185 RepID=UPI0028B099EC
ARWAGAFAGGVLVAFMLAGCALPGVSFGGGGSQPRPTAGVDDLQGVETAVSAADPRVTDVSGTVNYSGMSRMLTLAVIMSGDEPVTTSTLTSVLIAARDATSSDIESIVVIAREAADEEKIIDLQDAIAGLPSDVTPLWDGGVTLSRVDLDKLRPVS